MERIEKKLSWWNEIGLGAGLILGYLLYFFYQVFTPQTALEVMILEPVMSELNIGYIPSTLNRPYPPSFRDVLIADMNLYSSLPHDKPVTALNPTFNDDKSPVLKQKKIEINNYDGVQLVFETVDYPLCFENIEKDISLYTKILTEFVASRL